MQRAEESHAAERAAMIARLDRLLPAPELELEVSTGSSAARFRDRVRLQVQRLVRFR